MAMTSTQYAGQLRAYLPPGDALAAPDGSTLSALLAGLAGELERVDARGDDLLSQVFPDVTTELLDAWERVTGLPDTCSAGITRTVAQRQTAVVAHLAQNAEPTAAFLVSAAAGIGYAITITPRHAHRCGGNCGLPLGGTDWDFTFVIALTSGASLVSYAHCGDPCGSRLAVYTSTDLLCLIGHLKPAHTVMFIA
jgi:uncharacterized protein YmfQ (DUF2313 family)